MNNSVRFFALATILAVSACGSTTKSPASVDRAELASTLGGDEPVSNEVINDLCDRVGADSGCDPCAELGFYEDAVCDSYCPQADSQCDGQQTITQTDSLQVCSKADLADAGFSTTDFQITDVNMENTTLVVGVGYSGGCADHEFVACWSGNRNDDGSVDVILGHNGNGDLCEAYPQHDVRFELKEELKRDDATVHIDGTEFSVEYKTDGIAHSDELTLCDDAKIAQLENAGFEIVDKVDALSVDGAELVVDVSYGGGCAPHDFQLCWSGVVLESAPTQTPLTLLHNANGDGCEAFISDQVRFGLGVLDGAEETYLQVGGESVLYEP